MMNRILKEGSFKKNIAAAAFMACMAVVYAFMMYGNKPWYDELYTYYYFISRGPIYAAIHWPVPNNHVGYSVLSACLDVFSDPFIRLRGISYIAAIANLALIYVFCCRFMRREFALSVSMLYAGAGLVHRLSIQGRGYTLAVTCFLIVLISLYDICLTDKAGRGSFIWLAIGLTYGLYIVPSSVYWVIPSCLTAGIYVLIKKKYDLLKRLIVTGLIAAFVTFCLYALIWLAIGANIVSKDSSLAYFGMHQVKVILKAPFLSFKTGMEYMLASPYIQSIDRVDCIKGMPDYLTALFDNFYDGFGIFIMAVTALIALYAIVGIFLHVKKRDTDLFGCLFICICLIVVPVMLLIQSVHPYKRVLGFYMLPIAFGTVYMLDHVVKKVIGENRDRLLTGVCVAFACIFTLICGLSISSDGNRAPLADKENDLKEVFDLIDVKEIDNIFYTDDYQKYVLKFYYDASPAESPTLEGADWVVVSAELTDPGNTEPEWPILYGYDENLLEQIYSSFESIAINEEYAVYRRSY